MKAILVALVFVMPQARANAVDLSAISIFDCRVQENMFVEELCLDNEFIKLDKLMKANYLAMISSNIGGAKRDLRVTQKKWISNIKRCKDVGCVKDGYRERINAICDYPVISGIYPVCEIIEY